MENMTIITLYHNPKCSKSRQALALLQASGKAFTVHEYLKQPLSAAQLRALLQQCRCAPSDFIRPNEAEFQTAGLSDPATLSADEVIQAIARHPKLMQRPIIATAGKATIARPPTQPQEIL
jgi:arsenate reductase (glutaredoxin)